MKNYLVSEFFGVKDPNKFMSSLQDTIHQVPGQGVFAGDNLFTFGRNLSFLDDAVFMGAFEKNASTVTEKAILWRTAIVYWAAKQGLRLEGDFVECGCYRGTTARIISDALQLGRTAKKYYLYDTFEKDPRNEELTSDQFESEVRSRFCDDSHVVITKGFVPESLNLASPTKIAFMHIDMNNSAAELGALNTLFARMVPGAVVILDDYGWILHRDQRLQEELFFQAQGRPVFELPTGQGLVIC